MSKPSLSRIPTARCHARGGRLFPRHAWPSSPLRWGCPSMCSPTTTRSSTLGHSFHTCSSRYLRACATSSVAYNLSNLRRLSPHRKMTKKSNGHVFSLLMRLQDTLSTGKCCQACQHHDPASWRQLTTARRVCQRAFGQTWRSAVTAGTARGDLSSISHCERCSHNR